ncbi:MAG: hypothetical protein WD512_01605, partial [Candidatus Paceibacterota bacterium]
IYNLNPYSELPPAGQSMELFFEVEGLEKGEEYYLISNLDEQSSMLNPAIQEPTSSGIKLRFDLPAPILSLSYSLIVKRGLQIVAGSDTVKLERDCFPILGNAKIDPPASGSSKSTADFFRQAKNLENDFANYSQIFLQLDYLKTVLKEK